MKSNNERTSSEKDGKVGKQGRNLHPHTHQRSNYNKKSPEKNLKSAEQSSVPGGEGKTTQKRYVRHMINQDSSSSLTLAHSSRKRNGVGRE